MYIALRKDYAGFTPPAGDLGLLKPWAERGVLLLNAYPCTSEANSHSSKGWEKLMQRAIDVIPARKGVLLAWGKLTEERVAKVDRRKHAVLLSVHPSPLSAFRGFVSVAVSLVIDGFWVVLLIFFRFFSWGGIV